MEAAGANNHTYGDNTVAFRRLEEAMHRSLVRASGAHLPRMQVPDASSPVI